jgi:PTH1 family peptidyl-tRNA hydrolase
VADPRKVIFGIGNPDEKYADTRHNVGWMVVEKLSDKMGRKFGKAGFEFEAAEGNLGRAKVAVVKSWTYVNLSGRVMPELKRYGDLSTDLLVVCDDIALPLGSVRIRKSGSAGGHNGLKSIIEAIGDGFCRMRLGIGGPGAAANPDYVLGRFKKDERPAVEEMIAFACEAAECWAVDGVDKAMNKFNRVPKEDKDGDGKTDEKKESRKSKDTKDSKDAKE